jgi:hypothetical protein
VRRPELGPNDMSHPLWPRIEDQLFSGDAEVIKQHIVRIGRFLF